MPHCASHTTTAVLNGDESAVSDTDQQGCAAVSAAAEKSDALEHSSKPATNGTVISVKTAAHLSSEANVVADVVGHGESPALL
jgi:hypothetical protein